MSDDKMTNFERAFSNRTAGCYRVCECGINYFHDEDGSYDWEEGELERLRASAAAPNGKTVALDYCPGDIGFEGKEFVDACDCWHKRAEQIMSFLDRHGHKVAEYFSLEKKRKLEAAESSPVVEG
jgi:hypothetical protein